MPDAVASRLSQFMRYCRRSGSQEKAEEVPYQQRAVQEHGYLIRCKDDPISGSLYARPTVTRLTTWNGFVSILTRSWHCLRGGYNTLVY